MSFTNNGAMMFPMLLQKDEELNDVEIDQGIERMSKKWREKLFVASERDWNSNELFQNL